MSAYPLCFVAGRCEKGFEPALQAAQGALSAMDAVFYDPNEVMAQVARDGFGIFKADSWLAREITDLDFSFDPESKLVTCTVLSPSFVPIDGCGAPLVSSVLPFVADALEDAIFVLIPVTSNSISRHFPGNAYFRKCEGMKPEDYVISDKSIKEDPSDKLVPVKLEGFSSLAQFALPYMHELSQEVQRAEGESMLKSLVRLLEKLDDTPEQMDAMLELEWGPLFDYYWMAYSAMSERENFADREATRLYNTMNGKKMEALSTFDNAVITFSKDTIPTMKAGLVSFFEEKGLDLAKTELRSGETNA